MTVYADFSDGTQSATIDIGQSISFNVDFFSMNLPITAKVQLYSGSNLINTFLDNNINQKTYSHTYTYTPTTAGSYEIRVIGTDKINTDSEYLILTVNSIPVPPVNHAPVITSVPIIQVDEGDVYNYDVSATDADGDTLTYSLTQKPSWLSINSATGLITGTAPLVNSDTDYDVRVKVSDGKGGIDTQDYTLTVLDTSIPDITPPEITIISPEDREYDTYTISLRILTDEPAEVTFRLNEGAVIEMDNPSDNLFTYTLHVDSQGSHIITFYAEDASGNIAKEYARFSIKIKESHGGGGAAISTISEDFYYPNKYFDQFNTDKATYKTPKTTSTTTSTTKNYESPVLFLFYILIGLISLGIIIVVFLLGKNLRR